VLVFCFVALRFRERVFVIEFLGIDFGDGVEMGGALNRAARETKGKEHTRAHRSRAARGPKKAASSTRRRARGSSSRRA
jgi:hypothetical protein